MGFVKNCDIDFYNHVLDLFARRDVTDKEEARFFIRLAECISKESARG